MMDRVNIWSFVLLLMCTCVDPLAALDVATLSDSIQRACSVYCYGDILTAVQLSGIFNDSKTFVDMPMKYDPEVVNAAFLGIDASDTAQLMQFLDTYFGEVGSDLNPWMPPDLQENPPFLAAIDDANLAAWASDLNQLWQVLGREVDASVALNPQRHSFVPRAYPMIVPGGRFRESYYWDTWWIIRGLLVCDMTTTAEYVILNLLDDVENFGFVPNGGRIYYLDRSQPPLLSEMVTSYMDKLGAGSENATRMLARAFPLLQEEYEFWMDEGEGHLVSVSDDLGDTYRLNRYFSNSSIPRPESYAEDVETQSSSGRNAADMYGSIRAGAESGWDFSSRWIAGSKPKDRTSDIKAKDIIPVELNAIMYRWELNMIKFSELMGSGTLAEYFTEAARLRRESIDAVLWQSDESDPDSIDPTIGLWFDYNISSAQSVKMDGDASLSISQWVPMWAGLADGKNSEGLLSTLHKSGLLQAGGVLTTLAENTGQQWDSPNSWAPLVMFTVEGLAQVGIPAGWYLARNISKNWIHTNYEAYSQTGYMYEKYNAYDVGSGGGGGEYVPQVGFGWTNGVALVLLNSSFQTPPDQSGSDEDEQISILMITMISICGTLVVCGLLFFISFRCFKKFAPNKTMAEVFTSVVSPSRGRLGSVNDGTKSRPSNEITSRSNISGRSVNDSKSSAVPEALLERMVLSDEASEQSAAYF